jgi:hypothetical protein
MALNQLFSLSVLILMRFHQFDIFPVFNNIPSFTETLKRRLLVKLAKPNYN